MRIALFATASFAGVALVAVVVAQASGAATAKAPGASAKAPGAVNCPAPKPAPRPAPRAARPTCPAQRTAVERRRGAGTRVLAARTGRVERRRGGDDFGVAPSQAFVYGREMERDRRDFASERLAERRAPVAPNQARLAEERRESDRRRFAADGEHRSREGGQRGVEDRSGTLSSHSYRVERGESDGRGYVEGDRDGRRFGWSWGGGADRDGRTGAVRGNGDRDYRWRHGQGGGYEVYRYAGRDENGYLVWPGKAR